MFPKNVSVNWSDPNPAGVVSEYRIARNGAPAGMSTAVPFVDSIPAPGTYTYDVFAANAQEVSAPASGVFIALPVPAPVTSVTITVA